jgi:hypothetical protein
VFSKHEGGNRNVCFFELLHDVDVASFCHIMVKRGVSTSLSISKKQTFLFFGQLKMSKRADNTPAIYHASFTTFVDDYKLRGRDPSTTVSEFFSTHDGAEEFLLYHFRKALKGHDASHYSAHRDFKDFVAEEGYWKTKEMDFGTCVAVLEDMPGEFVPTPYDWDIQEVDVDTWVNPSKKAKINE